jgi:hypothetical protein
MNIVRETHRGILYNYNADKKKIIVIKKIKKQLIFLYFSMQFRFKEK